MEQIIIDLGTFNIFGNEIPLRVFGYGLMLVFGFIIGIALAQWRAKRAGEDPEVIAQVGILALVGGVVGARLLYVGRHWEDYANSSNFIGDVLNVTSGGLVYFGGLAGGALLVVVYLHFKKLPLRRFLDIVAPSLMIGLAFGRAGCTLNGCCWGGPCEENWALSVKFPMVSRPLLKFDGRDNPYSTGQTPSPVYAELYWMGQITPDSRLMNSFVTHNRELDDGTMSERLALIDVDNYHGKLTNDQLATMTGSRADAEKKFKQQWNEARNAGDGLLLGSEIWDEAISFDREKSTGQPRDGRLDFDEFWEYLQARWAALIDRFDANGDGQLVGAERDAANEYLQADMFEILAMQKTPPRRPAQMLGIINGLLMAALLAAFYRHRKREGQVFALLMMTYPLTRFMLESIRHDDPLNVLHGNWTHNQISGLCIVAVGFIFWFVLKKLPASAGPVLAERLAAANDSKK